MLDWSHMDEELLFPTRAAEALGVSTATLRRYAQAWEKAIGPLPRAPGGGRLWPASALARLAAARELAQRKGLLLEEALLRVEGEPPPLVAKPRPEEEVLVLLRKLVAKVEALEEEVRGLTRAIETLCALWELSPNHEKR
jgi:DNA-binding transcriptional MerR regulator